MGLDIYPGDAHWSYSGFNRFRELIAEAEGIELRSMVGFGGEIEWSTVESILEPFLDHSDCDGDISREDCAIMWRRLEEIVESFADSKSIDQQYGLQEGRKLVHGMKCCAESGERLIFR